MIPIPPSAVPATTTPSYPANAVNPIAPRTPIAAVASRSTSRLSITCPRSAALRASDTSRLPTAVRPASVTPPTIPSTAVTVA